MLDEDTASRRWSGRTSSSGFGTVRPMPFNSPTACVARVRDGRMTFHIQPERRQRRGHERLAPTDRGDERARGAGTEAVAVHCTELQSSAVTFNETALS